MSLLHNIQKSSALTPRPLLHNIQKSSALTPEPLLHNIQKSLHLRWRMEHSQNLYFRTFSISQPYFSLSFFQQFWDGRNYKFYLFFYLQYKTEVQKIFRNFLFVKFYTSQNENLWHSYKSTQGLMVKAIPVRMSLPMAGDAFTVTMVFSKSCFKLLSQLSFIFL